MKYGLVTVRLNYLKPLELTIDEIEEGKLSEYIMASSYLPIFKMNKIIDDSYYFDGGISNNLPISILERLGCDKIVAIRIDGIGRRKRKTNSNTKIIEISPSKNTGSIILFDNNDIVNNYYMGYFDTLSYFKKLDGFKYYFKIFKHYEYLVRNVKDSSLTLIKLKYKESDVKNIVIRSIEDILENNNIYYYKVYSIPKIIRYIKKNNLKSKHKLINDFAYSLKLFID